MIKPNGLTDMSQATRWWLPSITGIFFGFVFFVLTFTPSLVPRPPVFQGLLGGLAFFIGYAIGHCGVLLWRYLELPEIPRPWRRAANLVLALACAIFAAIYIPQAAAWQNEVRNRMHMPPAETANLLQVGVVAAIVAVLLVLLARLLIGGIRGASSVVYRWVPRRIAALLGAVIFAVLLGDRGERHTSQRHHRRDRPRTGAGGCHQSAGRIRANGGYEIGWSRLSDRVAGSRPSRQAIRHGGAEEGGY
jgi:uncharacterized membrane protein